MPKHLISSQYAEQIVPATNTDKFYLVCVWQDSTSGVYSTEINYGRRGAEGSFKEYYRGPSKAAADAAASKQWSAKTVKGAYRPSNVPQSIMNRLHRRSGLPANVPITGAPAAPSAPAGTPAPPPAPVHAVTAAEWQSALANNDYIPTQEVDLTTAQRVYVQFPSKKGAKAVLVAVHPDPTKRGSYLAAPNTKTNAAERTLFRLLDAKNPTVQDTLIDAFLTAEARPTLVLVDVQRFDGQDLRKRPYSDRRLILEQIIEELEGDSQIARGQGGWHPITEMPRSAKRPGAKMWLRKLGAIYDPNEPLAWIRLRP